MAKPDRPSRPTNAAEVRAFLDRRVDRPRNELPAVSIVGSTATIRLYDSIDSWGEWFGLSADEFAATLDGLPATVDTIELLINSPGGEVFEGIAIVNTLRAHPAGTRAVVQGIAASAASFIACACDETVMQPNSTLMIHDAWGGCIGNADDMLATAELLEKLTANIADIYARKSAVDVDEIRVLMAAETFMTDVEAVAAGLADRIEEPVEPANRQPHPAATITPNPSPVPAAAAAPEFYKIAANANRRRRGNQPTPQYGGKL